MQHDQDDNNEEMEITLMLDKNKIKWENGQSAMLDFFAELRPKRKSLFNLGNLTGKFCHRNYPL